MRGNALFSGLSGLVALVGARPIADFIGIPAPLALVVIGLMLIGYEFILFWATAQEEVAGYGRLAVVLDIGWVLGSIMLIFSNWLPLTTAGKWTIGLLAEVVFWFAVWQGFTLWKQK
jgi:hypothetical protein